MASFRPAPLQPTVELTLRAFLRSALARSPADGFRGLALGLSGGLDSSTTAALVRRAVGRARSLAVVVDLELPGHRDQTATSLRVARALDVPCRVVRAGPLLKELLELERRRGPFSEVNAVSRTIHTVIAQAADNRSFAVVSCVDRSEELLARHTEFFYGHLAPLASIFKTQVRGLAERTGVPAFVAALPPGCVEAWPDDRVLGAPYEVVDAVLSLMVDRGFSPREIHRRWGGNLAWLERVSARIQQQDWRMVTRRPDLNARRAPPRWIHRPRGPSGLVPPLRLHRLSKP